MSTASPGPASALIRGATPEGPGYRLSVSAWASLPAALAREPGLALMALWAEPGRIHAAFLDEAAPALLLADAPALEGRYAALSPVRPGAVSFERMVHDLWGLTAIDAVDLRSRLDHGSWPSAAPLSLRPVPNTRTPTEPDLPAVAGEGLQQVAVGPVYASIAEPGQFRLDLQGETVVRMEARLGYTHKGTFGLMQGRSPRAAARYAARLSGDSTVSHAWAFARAAEQALGVSPPPRAMILRAVMAELERLHNHLNDFGSLCDEAGFNWLHARTATLREAVLHAAQFSFGHRLMMDAVIPGGVAQDLAPGGAEALLSAINAIDTELPTLTRTYEDHASLQDRTVGTGLLSTDLVARYAAGGYVGRASGRGFDARLVLPYPPYDQLPPRVPVLVAGDVDARLRVRLAEIPESIHAMRRLLDALRPGEVALPLPQRAGSGVGLVEGFRGDCLAWLRLDDGGLIKAVFLRDPSWLHWPLLEAMVRDTSLADFLLCKASINPSHSGVDL